MHFWWELQVCWQASVVQAYLLLVGDFCSLTRGPLHRLLESLYDVAVASLRSTDEKEPKTETRVCYNLIVGVPSAVISWVTQRSPDTAWGGLYKGEGHKGPSWRLAVTNINST